MSGVDLVWIWCGFGVGDAATFALTESDRFDFQQFIPEIFILQSLS